MADQMSREAALKSNPLVSVGLTGDSLSAKVPIECIYVAVNVCMHVCLCPLSICYVYVYASVYSQLS